MRTLYIDCFSGASGDMLLGALVDLGVDPAALYDELQRFELESFEIVTSRVLRSHLSAVKVDVVVGGRIEGPGGAIETYEGPERHGHARSHDHSHPHADDHGHEHHDHGHEHHDHGSSRSLAEILEIVGRSGLSDSVKSRVARIFTRLGEAEARAHGTAIEQVHLHEVGAVDAIVDISGACVGIEMLGVERVVCSPVNVGGGTVTFSHGTYPVPTPATVELLRGAPIHSSGDVQKELVTPTGAAIVTTLADEFGAVPHMTLERTGYGAGARDLPGRPNVLRLLLGESEPGAGAEDRVVVVEATIDDSTAETLGHFAERALEEGALDVYFVPAQMKKGRPGVELTLVARPEDLDRMAELVFRETTTIGLRHREVSRRVLEREHVVVETAVGPIRIKVARLGGEVVNAAPEYEDCRRAAREHSVPLIHVQTLAAAAWSRRDDG